MQFSTANHTRNDSLPQTGLRKRKLTSKKCYNYYPFGLQAANSWTRDNTTNNFLANGGTELNTVSALYDLSYRNYDAALGRFHQVDPMADKFGSHTPYNYSFGNPVSLNDPSGASPWYGGMGNGPMVNYHMDADHEGPQYGWIAKMTSNGDGGVIGGIYGDLTGHFNLDGDATIGAGGGESMSLGDFLKTGGRDNGGTWSGGNAHFYTPEEASARDITLNAQFDAWTKANATMYAKCPTCPGGDKYKAFIEDDKNWFYDGKDVTPLLNEVEVVGHTGSGISIQDPNTTSMINGMSFGLGTAMNIMDWTIKLSTSKYAKIATEYAKDIAQGAAKYSTKLAIAGMLISSGVAVNDYFTKGTVSTSSQLDMFFGGLAFVPGADVATIIYAGANIGWNIAYGKSIGQSIDENYIIVPIGGAGIPSVILIPKK